MMLWSETFAGQTSAIIPAGVEVLLDAQPGTVTDLQLDGVLRVREGYTLMGVRVHGPGLVRPEIDPPAAPVMSARIVSRLAFLDRFTDAELAAILAAAASSQAIEVWVKKLDLAGEVDLDSARTVAGVNALEAAGLIGAGRAALILA